MALISDSESDSEVPQFGVNKDFATQYETKKRSEELSKREPNRPLTLESHQGHARLSLFPSSCWHGC